MTTFSETVRVYTANRKDGGNFVKPIDYHCHYWTLKPLTPSDWYTNRHLEHQIPFYTVRTGAHTVYLCVLCGSENKRGSENKQRLFPYTALTDWFL
jgi:hypothetical protein